MKECLILNTIRAQDEINVKYRIGCTPLGKMNRTGILRTAELPLVDKMKGSGY